MARWLDKEQAAVNARVLEVTLTLGGKLLAEVGAVLVFDVLDNGVPAAFVVDQITVAGGVNDVEAQTHSIFLNGMRDSLDLGGLTDGFIGEKASLAVDKVRGEDGVDEGRLAQTCLTCRRDVRGQLRERRAAGSLPTQMMLNWKPRFTSFFSICLVMVSKPT